MRTILMLIVVAGLAGGLLSASDRAPDSSDAYSVDAAWSPTELVAFIDAQRDRVKVIAEQFAGDRAAMQAALEEHAQRSPAAIIEAADLILKHPNSTDDDLRTADKAKHDSQIALLPTMTDQSQREVVERILADRVPMRDIDAAWDVIMAGQALEFTFRPASRDLARTLYRDAAGWFIDGDDQNARSLAQRMLGLARRIELIGDTLTLEGRTLDDQPVALTDLRGKAVLVHCFATWCAACQIERPLIEEAYNRHHDAGFEVVAISFDDEKAWVEEYQQAQRPPWPVIHDAELAARLAADFGIEGFPVSILIGRDGEVVSVAARGPRLEALLSKVMPDDSR